MPSIDQICSFQLESRNLCIILEVSIKTLFIWACQSFISLVYAFSVQFVTLFGEVYIKHQPFRVSERNIVILTKFDKVWKYSYVFCTSWWRL